MSQRKDGLLGVRNNKAMARNQIIELPVLSHMARKDINPYGLA